MSEREKRYQQALSHGHSAAWDQEWDRAATFYRQALDEMPDDPKALTSLALALFELQEHDESLRYYLRAAETTPDDPIPLEKAATLYDILHKPGVAAEMAVHAAELYLKSKDVEKAIENWSRAVGMNPEHLIAHSRLAIVYERLGRKSKAVQEYLHIASLMQHAGSKGKAAQVINRALGISPNSEKARRSLAMLRDGIMLPKPERPQGGTAPVQLIQTPQLEPPKKRSDSELNPIEESRHRALSALATLFFEQTSENDNAQTSHRDLSAIVDGTGYLFAKNVDQTKLMLHLGQAVEFLTNEDTARAAEELKRVIDIGLHHPAAYYILGLLWTEGDRLESAFRYLQRAVSHPDFALGVRLLMGEVLQKKAQWHEASVEYLEALRLADSQVVHPEHADGLRQLYEPSIEAHAQDAEEKQCVQLCESISDLLVRPRWQHHLKNMRKQLVPQDGDGPPTPLIDVLTEAGNSQVVIAMSTVRQLAREGRPQTAMEEAFYALQRAPTYLPLHVAIGELLFSEGQVQEAIEKFMVVSRSYSVRGETGRATDMLRRVVAMSPMDIDARICLIDQLIARGESENVIEEYIKLAEVRYSMAELLEARKTYTRALRYAQQTGASPAWRVRVLHRIADIDVQSLNWRQALTIYEQICALQLDDIRACNKLIDLNFRLGERTQALAGMNQFITYMNREGREDDVIEFMENLVNERPQQAMIRWRLAEQYQKAGRTSDAIKQLDTAGDILLDAGDRKGASDAIQMIVNLNPPDVGKYKQLLERIKSN